jgi:two-component system, OmpR family, response regulator RpaB
VALGKIVVVEDERPIREGIAAALRAAGYESIEAADGEAGLAAGRRPGVDLVLLDLLLPKMDGMEVLKNLRQTHPTLPIIVLTARGTEDDRVAGLKGGADDYVVKPFSARELVARVAAVLRRSPERPEAVTSLSIAKATVDLARREVCAADAKSQALSETECSILTHLAANHGRAISRDELLNRVWGLSGAGIETRTIDMHVARLRSKLSALSGRPGESIIATVRGKGYMLGPDVRLPESPGEGKRTGGRK